MGGEAAINSLVLIDGFASRIRYLRTGEAHIAAFVVPGDICNLRSLLLRHLKTSFESPGREVGHEYPPHSILSTYFACGRVALD